MRMIPCPACGAQLQPVPATSRYVSQAMEHARQLDLVIPDHGPAVLVWAALVSHAMLVHDELDLGEYLEAYLSQ